MNQRNSFFQVFTIIILLFFFIAAEPFFLYGEERRYRPELEIALSDSAVISLITISAGTEVYSLFGHSGFRLYDPENSIDWLYNYGTFDFNDPLFVVKFLRGQLDYYLDVVSFPRSLDFYENVEKRAVIEQVLSLERRELEALFDFLQNNAKIENRYYRYDFVNDNCSTRLPDGLERTFAELGGIPEIIYPEWALSPLADNTFSEFGNIGAGSSWQGLTYREMIRRCLESVPSLDFGIQLILGSKTDMLAAEGGALGGGGVMFLPFPLMEIFESTYMLRDSKSEKANSGITEKQSIVSETIELAPYQTILKNDAINYPFFIFLFIGLIYLRFVIYLISGNNRIKKPALFITSFCEKTIYLFTAIFGVLIFYLWFFSDHTVTNLNYNLLWCNPLNFLLLFRKAFPKVRKVVMWINTVFVPIYIICALIGLQAALPAFFPPAIISFIAGARKTILVDKFKNQLKEVKN